MRRALPAFLLAVQALSSLPAQTKEFRFVSDLKIDVSDAALRRGGGILSVGPSGQMVFLPEFYRSAFRAFDSSGNDLKWSLPIGRGNEHEIGWVNRIGWVGDSMWIQDRMYDQVVVVDPAGKVMRSMEDPSWVRPGWSDRRRYPLFAAMSWEAVLSDGTLIVLPGESRNIFDTPKYDRDYNYLLHTDADGRILNTVARFPVMEGNLELRSGAERKRIRVDHYARTFWRVGSSGQRTVIVQPLRADSGAFVVTVTTPLGDTVYSKRYSATTRRIPPARRDSLLGKHTAFGRYSATAIRDTMDKLMAIHDSPVVNLTVGIDGSVWVWLREPGTPPNNWRAMIIDPAGNVVGMTILPRSFRTADVSANHLWALTRDGNKAFVERFRREPATAVRPSRSARTSASLRR